MWKNILEFEQDIANFFLTQGLECNIVTPLGGSSGQKLILVKPVDTNKFLTNQKGPSLRNVPGKSSKNIVKGLTNQAVQSFNKQFPGSKVKTQKK